MTTRELLHTEIDTLNQQQLEALQKLVDEFIKPLQTTQTTLKRGKGWSEELISKTCGTWEGEPLTRPTQPEYDNRNQLI